MSKKAYSNKAKGLDLLYPDSWNAELTDNVLSVYDPINGVGVLQFSTYLNSNPEKNINLKAELSAFLKNKDGYIEISVNGNYASTNYLDEEGRYWEYWLFLTQSTLILASYNCERDDIGKEDEEIKEIIHSSNK